jgi:hypothetical protein
VSILGGWSAVTILNPEGDDINIPDGPIVVNPNIGNSSIQISVPFNITNGGVYELSNIFIGFQLDMNFENSSAGNASTTVQIFKKFRPYGKVLPGGVLKANFNGAGILPLSEVNWDRSPHDIYFYASLIFSASYSLNLYTFTVAIVNISLGYYDNP